MTSHTEAMAILEEFGIRAVPIHVMPRFGETRAVATLQRIVNRHGFAHGRAVVQFLAESDNNRHPMVDVILWAMSDVLRLMEKQYPEIMENEISRVFEFFDGVPLGAIEHKFVRPLDGITSKRAAMVGLITERLVRCFGDPQGDLLDDRRMTA